MLRGLDALSPRELELIKVCVMTTRSDLTFNSNFSDGRACLQCRQATPSSIGTLVLTHVERTREDCGKLRVPHQPRFTDLPHFTFSL